MSSAHQIMRDARQEMYTKPELIRFVDGFLLVLKGKEFMLKPRKYRNIKNLEKLINK